MCWHELYMEAIRMLDDGGPRSRRNSRQKVRAYIFARMRQ